MLKIELPAPNVLIAKKVPNGSKLLNIITSKKNTWITWYRVYKSGVFEVSFCIKSNFECQNDTHYVQLTKEEIKLLAEAAGYKIK
jgi:hypothetical protein